MNRIRKLLITFCVGALLFLQGATAGAQVSEYALKAALLFKLAKFVEWPEEAFDNSDSPITFCIIGKNQFGEHIGALKGRQIHGRMVNVQTIRRLTAKETECHIAFISGSEKDRMPSIERMMGHLPILTVGDFDQFIDHGGLVSMIVRNERVQFEIDNAACLHRDLRLSAQLLDMAKITNRMAGASE